MRGKFKDFTGKRIGNRIVLKRVRLGERVVFWQVKCDCGKVGVVKSGALSKVNPNLSCRSCANKKHGYSVRGSDNHYLYVLWCGIKQRCFYEKKDHFDCYGGRGIKMSKKWIKDFVSFRKYIEKILGERPKEHSIDRILNNKGYFPGNLKWSSQKQQCRNTRRTYTVIRIDKNGKEKKYGCLQAVVKDGFLKQSVWKVINGYFKTHKGYRWEKLQEKAVDNG